MSNLKFTYRIGSVLLAAVAWEVVFWLTLLVFMAAFGYVGDLNTDDKLVFKYPMYFRLFLLIIPLGAAYFYQLVRSNRIVQNIDATVWKYILQPVSSIKSFLSYFFFRNAIVFLVIALAQPYYGKMKVDGSVESLELVVALDVSNSMNTMDVDKNASRLEVSKRALIQLINSLHGEKIGVCIFAGDAYVQLPLTSDYHAAKMFISEIETGMLSHQGTNIPNALETSVGMFSKERTSKGIILVTDGENHESSSDEIFEEIGDQKIQVCALGIGTKEGGMIPNNPSRAELGYKKTPTGILIVSKVNEQMIVKIAKKVNGFSMMSSEPFPDLSQLLRKLNEMERTKTDNLEFNLEQSRYQIPLFISIGCWLFFSFFSLNYFNSNTKFVKNI